MKELARSYLIITKDVARVMNRIKALYRSWGIPRVGNEVYAQVTASSRRGDFSLDIPFYRISKVIPFY
jgi:hypothetical protein